MFVERMLLLSKNEELTMLPIMVELVIELFSTLELYRTDAQIVVLKIEEAFEDEALKTDRTIELLSMVELSMVLLYTLDAAVIEQLYRLLV